MTGSPHIIACWDGKEKQHVPLIAVDGVWRDGAQEEAADVREEQLEWEQQHRLLLVEKLKQQSQVLRSRPRLSLGPKTASHHTAHPKTATGFAF
jgi:hypothetical protein